MRQATILRSYTFEAAHHLPHTPEQHKCHTVHGHSYTVSVAVEGPIDPVFGWVCDFAELDDIVHPLVRLCDHQLLNGLVPNPTSENVACWFLDQLKTLRPLQASWAFKSVRLSETVRSWAEVE